MVQFSSKPPFNDDPYPTYPPGGHPMYDRPQHNPSNPILLEFRELHAATGNPLWTDAYLSASDLIEEWDEHDTKHWDHAMDVFTRILRMSK